MELLLQAVPVKRGLKRKSSYKAVTGGWGTGVSGSIPIRVGGVGVCGAASGNGASGFSRSEPVSAASWEVVGSFV